MKFTQKYAIIQLLEDKKADYEYDSSNWPLHVTLADTFAIDWEKNDVRNKLAQLLAEQKPVVATAGHDEYFGSEKQTQVTILNMSEELVALHYAVVELLESAGLAFNDPQFAKEGFRAHATVQSHARLNSGDEVVFNSLAIIDMFPGGDPYRRKILQIMTLGDAVQ